MQASSYRHKWNALKEKKVDPETVGRLSREIAYSFLDYYLKDCRYEKEYIDLLCEMTTFSENTQLTSPAAQALFGIIIESLCDDFEELQTLTYNQVMTQIISYCRQIPGGRELDLTLRDFGIYSSNELLDRIQKLRHDSSPLPCNEDIQKIFLLSRVTIGADVAVTSVFMQRLMKIYPEAEIVLIGGRNLSELYGGNPRIKIRSVSYSKKGGLLQRLSSWHLVLQIIKEELASCPIEKAILVDSDSRLSQLGILPLFPRDRYFYFDSRSDTSFSKQMSMAELANSWLDDISGQRDFCFPKVWIPGSYLEGATRFCIKLRDNGAQKIIIINFGVGANPRKRVGRPLEEKLVMTLLREPNTVIVLDKGFGEEELVSANGLIGLVEKRGYPVYHSFFDSRTNVEINWGVVGLQSRIGQMGALIAKGDEFIGYDSACQHIAAAVGTPCVTIFAGSNNMRFVRRWSAFGPKSSNIVHVDTLRDPSSIEVDDIISRIMHVRSLQGGECAGTS